MDRTNQWYAPDTNRTNIHQALAVNAQARAVDTYTVEFKLSKPDPLFFFNSYFVSQAGGALQITSKNRHEQLGNEKAMFELPDGGTGPFRISRWVPDTELIVEAVEGHWRKTPSFREVKFTQITEPATLLAGLSAKEIDVAPIAITFKRDVEAAGLETRALGEGMYWMQFTGNYCIKEWNGQPVPPRPAYKPELPWVGNCDDPSDTEGARKVRWALSMAIDRQKLVDGVVGGRGRPLAVTDAAGQDWDLFQQRVGKKWEIPFDLAKAKQYLQEAGFPNGFQVESVCVTGRHPLSVELCEAVASQWEASGLGIRPVLSRQIYQGGIRDRLVNRDFAGMWSQAQGAEGDIFYPLGDAARRPDAAFNPGTEMLKPLELNDQALAARTPEELDRVLTEAVDWIFNWHYTFGVIGFEEVFAVNPGVVGNWARTQSPSQLLDYENLEHAK